MNQTMDNTYVCRVVNYHKQATGKTVLFYPFRNATTNIGGAPVWRTKDDWNTIGMVMDTSHGVLEQSVLAYCSQHPDQVILCPVYYNRGRYPYTFQLGMSETHNTLDMSARATARRGMAEEFGVSVQGDHLIRFSQGSVLTKQGNPRNFIVYTYDMTLGTHLSSSDMIPPKRGFDNKELKSGVIPTLPNTGKDLDKFFRKNLKFVNCPGDNIVGYIGILASDVTELYQNHQYKYYEAFRVNTRHMTYFEHD